MMPSSFTGKIHHGPSTVSAVFLNSARGEEFHCDEKDLSDYIGLSEGAAKNMYIEAITKLQNYKQDKGIELDYLPFAEWS